MLRAQAHTGVGRGAVCEHLPAEHAEAPDVALGRVRVHEQRLGRRPLDRDLLQALAHLVHRLLAAHPEIRDLHRVLVAHQTALNNTQTGR